MIFKTVLTTLFLTLCLGIDAQAMSRQSKHLYLHSNHLSEQSAASNIMRESIVRRIILMLAMATS